MKYNTGQEKRDMCKWGCWGWLLGRGGAVDESGRMSGSHLGEDMEVERQRLKTLLTKFRQ